MYKKLSITVMLLGVVFLVSVLILALSSPTLVDAQTDIIPDFVGSDICTDCHITQANQQEGHGHSYKLNAVVDGQPPDYPYSEVPNPPEGYTWEDVSFVIGGFGWKARFIDLGGYIITGDDDSTTQYNFPLIDERTGDVIVEENWVPYYAGQEERPYSCASCHTTGYNHDRSTNMYDMPGMLGQWVEEGIMCEECHGPGSLHVEEPIRVQMDIDRSSEGCGNCHYRGREGVVESGGGFIKHHEQYEEILTAPHAAMECIDCHNPHQSAVYADEDINPNRGLRTYCTDCHFDNNSSEEHVENGVTCTDCHMAPMTASGSSNADLLWADLSTHLYQINTNPAAPQFNEDGSAVMPYITVQYACTRCHVDQPLEEMIEAADGYHN